MFTLLYLIAFIILLICGKVKAALIILGVTLLIDLLIALLRVGARVTLDGGVFGLKVIAGPIRLKLLPSDPDREKKPKKEKPKKEKPKKEKPKKEKPKKAEPEEKPEGEKAEESGETPEEEKGSGIKVTLELISAVLSAVGELLGRLRRKISIDKLTIHYTVASNDPYNAAMTFACASAGVNALMPLFENIFKIKEHDVGADVTFEKSEAEIYIDAQLTIAIWEIIYVVLAVWPVVKVILAQIKQGKVDKNGQTSDQ